MKLRESVPLATYTTLKVGGAARWFTTVTSVDELREASSYARMHNLPVLLLGGGSNLLVDDEGWPGLVILIALRGREYTDLGTVVDLKVGAGETFDDIVAETTERGLWGLENLSAIPGSVGATPVQNVGAYGVEVKDRIVTLEVFNMLDGTMQRLEPSECRFGYRESLFKESEYRHLVICSVSFRLSRVLQAVLSYVDLEKWQIAHGKLTTPQAVREAVCAIRGDKFPDWHVVGTAGSFFKNPIVSSAEAVALHERFPELPLHPVGDEYVKVSLGYVLDKICGLRGYQEGAVRLYEKQALVLVQEGAITAREVCDFAEKISTLVQAKTGIKISPEVNLTKNFLLS